MNVVKTAARMAGLLVTVLLPASAALAQVTAIQHATVIDGTGAGPRADVTLVLENGRIREIGPSSSLQHPGGGERDHRDGQVRRARHYQRARSCGRKSRASAATVTPGTASRPRRAWRSIPTTSPDSEDQQKRGELRGARILTVKYRFSTLPVPGPAIRTPEAARAKVDEIVAAGADYIKVWVDAQEGKYPD